MLIDDDIKLCLGKVISGIKIDDIVLTISFNDESNLTLETSYACCEHRYMVCDDDLSSIIGNVLTNIQVRDAPDIKEDGYSEHEVQFLEISTNKGFITISNHNVHNGWYGGFCIRSEYKWPNKPEPDHDLMLNELVSIQEMSPPTGLVYHYTIKKSK